MHIWYGIPLGLAGVRLASSQIVAIALPGPAPPDPLSLACPALRSEPQLAARAQGVMLAAVVAPARLAGERPPGGASFPAGIPVALALGVGGVSHQSRIPGWAQFGGPIPTCRHHFAKAEHVMPSATVKHYAVLLVKMPVTTAVPLYFSM